jgi:hypothetical protein
MRTPDYIGKGIKKETVEHFYAELKNNREYLRGWLNDYEFEKNPDELKAIELFNRYYKNECEKIGMSFSQIEIDSIHFVPRDAIDILNGEDSSDAYIDEMTDTQEILIASDQFPNRIQLFEVLLHEMGHKVPSLKWHFEKDRYPISENGIEKTSAIGGGSHFTGLNEIILQGIVREIGLIHKKELKEELFVMDDEYEEYQTLPFGYDYYQPILDQIIKGISDVKKESAKNVWENMKRSYFESSILYLKVIDEIWGPGSLRVLATLGSYIHERNHGKDYNLSPVLSYFQSNDEEEKDMYMRQALGLEEIN